MGWIARSKPQEFDSLFATLAHRGPDASAKRAFGSTRWQTALGHHRLSIIDVAGGSQPMSSGDHSLVFNGEIYNFNRLRTQIRFNRWRTRSDTEVVLEWLRERGPGGLADLDGFFALAVHDSRDQSVLIARDRWGIKPLYFAQMPDGGLLFASELHPFLVAPGVRQSVSRSAIADFLFWDHFPYDRSALEGVRKLEPGKFLRWRDGRIEICTFYDHRRLLCQERRRVEPDGIWEVIKGSVRDAMISDVGMGILLSGGLDSSLVALAARELTGPGLPTFSVGFSDARFDEAPHARRVADMIQAEHHELRVTEADMLDRWETIVTELDEPLADPSLIPTRMLCELARRHVPVALGGDGGDELFGGYPTYRAARLRRFLDRIPSAAVTAIKDFLMANVRTGDGYQPFSWKLKRLIGRFDRDPRVGHLRWMSGTDLPELAKLLGSEVHPTMHDLDRLDASDGQTPLYLDLRHYLPYSVLAKVDRASMAVGLECRPPLLANACVEAAFAVPMDQKVSLAETKLILRRVAKGRLPDEIAGRAKRGFAVPLAKWLRNELATEVEGMLKESPLWDSGGLRPTAARGAWNGLREGKGDHSRTIWSLLVLHKWMVKRSIQVLADAQIEEVA